MNALDVYLAHLVDVVEGGTFTNDPDDAGGPTRWGITQATLAKWRGKPVVAADVKNLTRDEALAIYRDWYVTTPGFDKVAAVSMNVALEVIDTGVNMGAMTATRYLQRCLNLLADAPELVADGTCGPKTIVALQEYVAQRAARGVAVLVTALNGLQCADYVRLAENDSVDRKFIFGWLSQRVYQNINDWACGATT